VPFLNNRSLRNRSKLVGKFGAFFADLIVYKGFGLASFLLLFFLDWNLYTWYFIKKLKGIWFWDLFAIIFCPFYLVFCYFSTRIRRRL
jgi:S-DNA-T family DNA segregation ATPase FtsK/SpoIIIE